MRQIRLLPRFLLSLQTLFNGALIVENIFKYPGIGRLIRDAVFYRDYLLLQGIFLLLPCLSCASAHWEKRYTGGREGAQSEKSSKCAAVCTVLISVGSCVRSLFTVFSVFKIGHRTERASALPAVAGTLVRH